MPAVLRHICLCTAKAAFLQSQAGPARNATASQSGACTVTRANCARPAHDGSEKTDRRFRQVA